MTWSSGQRRCDTVCEVPTVSTWLLPLAGRRSDMRRRGVQAGGRATAMVHVVWRDSGSHHTSMANDSRLIDRVP